MQYIKHENMTLADNKLRVTCTSTAIAALWEVTYTCTAIAALVALRLSLLGTYTTCKSSHKNYKTKVKHIKILL